MERLFSQQRQEIRSTITDAVRNEISRELGGIREEMASLSADVGQVSSNQEAFEQRLAALETDRARRAFEATKCPPTSTPSPSASGFDRPADPTILKVNVDQKDKRAEVAIDKIEGLIKSLLDEKGWSNDILTVRGREVGNRFIVKFTSTANEVAMGQAKELVAAFSKWQVAHSSCS